eukprot:CAMPEP_0194274416 /NCGR_PEP_ID=MMETSP0169-20130528/7502_1 /TAXON_ID=218684 /ORGANISM="Corethron pennatum, Strain L29A3" /LENGTH=433 /DNA_ID=CAMNT_0039017597 /DNA_START=32 /DNA_END=1333 /DNA_ORIENTATION=-
MVIRRKTEIKKSKNRGKAACPHGPNCKYRNEYQHQLEFHHDAVNTSVGRNREGGAPPTTASFGGAGRCLNPGGGLGALPRARATGHASRIYRAARASAAAAARTSVGGRVPTPPFIGRILAADPASVASVASDRPPAVGRRWRDASPSRRNFRPPAPSPPPPTGGASNSSDGNGNGAVEECSASRDFIVIDDSDDSDDCASDDDVQIVSAHVRPGGSGATSSGTEGSVTPTGLRADSIGRVQPALVYGEAASSGSDLPSDGGREKNLTYNNDGVVDLCSSSDEDCDGGDHIRSDGENMVLNGSSGPVVIDSDDDRPGIRTDDSPRRGSDGATGDAHSSEPGSTGGDGGGRATVAFKLPRKCSARRLIGVFPRNAAAACLFRFLESQQELTSVVRNWGLYEVVGRGEIQRSDERTVANLGLVPSGVVVIHDNDS